MLFRTNYKWKRITRFIYILESAQSRGKQARPDYIINIMCWVLALRWIILNNLFWHAWGEYVCKNLDSSSTLKWFRVWDLSIGYFTFL